MTTVLFVHGTGVREEKFHRNFYKPLCEGLAERLPELKTEPCLWGETEGIDLSDALLTIPNYEKLRAKRKAERKSQSRSLLRPFARTQLPVPINQLGILRRASIMGDQAKFAGDILLYQGRGEGIRSYIRQRIMEIEPPVVLLAHSLGGVASVDLLIEEDLTERVKMLVTVGSQAPYLYAIDALHSLRKGDNLPAHLPYWLNIYNPYDVLSFIGHKIFRGKGQIEDRSVVSNFMLTQAHTAYFKNPDMYKILLEKIKERGLL